MNMSFTGLADISPVGGYPEITSLISSFLTKQANAMGGAAQDNVGSGVMVAQLADKAISGRA